MRGMMIRRTVAGLLAVAGMARAVPVNLAPSGTVSASSSGYGSVPADLNDGNREGHFYNGGSVWHTVIPDAAPWIEVDLGADRHLDRLMLWPRTDALQGTVKDLRIRVTDAAGRVVFSEVFLAGSPVSQPWATVAVRSVVGRRVRIERADVPVNPNFLTFAELEIHGQESPIPENLAAGKPWTASSSGAHGTPPGAGNDGIIGGDWNLPGRPVFHGATSAAGEFYQIDLGNGQAVDRTVDLVRIYNRTDFTNNAQLRLSLRNASGAEVWAQTVNVARETLVRNGRQHDITVDVPATVPARWARVETVFAEPLVFAELEVFGPGVDTVAPAVTSQDPAAGELLADLVQATVTFSEAVTGVEAADLLVNGVPATGHAAQSATVHRFTFGAPADGLVRFSWAAGHGIRDAADNPFGGGSWEVVLDRALPAPRPVIAEILAENRGGLRDADGDTPDWFELFNPGPTAVNLGGWHLSDEPGLLTKWTIPWPTVLPAGGSLVVFASGKDRREPGGELHTSFRLAASGDSLILTKPDGVTVASSVIGYPPQRENVSWGLGRRFDAVPAVASGAAARVLVPAGPVSGWRERSGFDDSGWLPAATGVGFDQTGGLGGAGPQGLWRFDEVAGAATDATGRGSAGVFGGAAARTPDGGGRSGRPGDRALSLTGSGSVSIGAAGSGTFDAVTAADAVAVAAWTFGAAAQPAPGFLFFAGSAADGSGTRVLGAHLPWSDSVIYWDTAGCCDAGRQRILISEPNPVMWRGRWNHYVFQKRGSRKEIWQNGLLLHDATNTDAMMNFRSFFIGSNAPTAGSGYQGLVDDFALWGRALGSEEIAALAAGVSPLESGLLTSAVRTDLATAMRHVNPGCLMRVPFDMAHPTGIDVMVLRMRSEDGFVAWLNGIEIARRNAPAGAEPAWNAAAPAASPGGAGLLTEEIDVSRFAPLLVAGRNVLAVQGFNAAASDPDFLLLPELHTGRSLTGRWFVEPTPGAPNGEGVGGFTAPVLFSPGRGFHEAPVTITLTCETPGAVIVHTTDGSQPSLTNGMASPSPATVQLTGTTTLRAGAWVPGTDAGPLAVETHTYLFPGSVAAQQRPAAAPETWPGGHPGDYVMDPRVASSTAPGYTLRDALLALPSLSVTAAPADLWGPSGIYANSTARGDGWMRQASAEWLDPAGAPGFHVRFGLSIHGNISRDKGFTPKHSFRMAFRSAFGASKLHHPVFPGSPVDEFDTLVLRAGSTDTFPCTEWAPVGIGPGGAGAQRWARRWASYVRDQWVRDTQLAMGQPSARGRYCHLYLNGIYWGLYNLCERPDEDFMAAHLGGRREDYDVLADFAEVKNGERSAWQQLMSFAGGSASDAMFQRLQGRNPDGSRNPDYPILLDADNLIDYMILHIHHGADDWPNHNWWAGRDTRGSATGFRWTAWDQEISSVNVLYERSSWQSAPARYADANAPDSPAAPYAALRQGSADFRMRFADRVQRHFFNGGALTTEAAKARWDARVAEIDRAIVAESARWGDYRPNLVNPGQPYRREVEWLGHLTWMASDYWPKIREAALKRYRDAGLFPALAAPGLSPAGGLHRPGTSASLTNSNASGSIRCTVDGSDPRLSGGAVNPASFVPAGPVAVSGRMMIRGRVLDGTTWSALTEAEFVPHPDADGDGMADEWESANGLDPADAGDAAVDRDGDGMPNGAEHAALTDPRDPGSVFRATAAALPDGGVEIRFTARAGRRYRLEASDSLTGWQSIRVRAAAVTDEAVVWREAPAGARRWFRVVAEVEPATVP